MKAVVSVARAAINFSFSEGTYLTSSEKPEKLSG